jgi:hypothetical protein
MKITYHVRSLKNNSIPFRAVFTSFEMAMIKKQSLEKSGDKVALYRNDEYGNSKRIA